jgi:hypothetical protein
VVLSLIALLLASESRDQPQRRPRSSVESARAGYRRVLSMLKRVHRIQTAAALSSLNVSLVWVLGNSFLALFVVRALGEHPALRGLRSQHAAWSQW